MTTLSIKDRRVIAGVCATLAFGAVAYATTPAAVINRASVISFEAIRQFNKAVISFSSPVNDFTKPFIILRDTIISDIPTSNYNAEGTPYISVQAPVSNAAKGSLQDKLERYAACSAKSRIHAEYLDPYIVNIGSCMATLKVSQKYTPEEIHWRLRQVL